MSFGDEPIPHGLTEIRRRMAAGQPPSMLQTMGFDLIEVDEGLAVLQGTPDARFLNPHRAVHGGYAAALLDSACGLAVHTRMRSDQGYTTLEIKVAYHRGLTSRSGVVRAEGRVVTLGRRAAFAEARMFDGGGRLCATATSTLLVFELPRPGG